MDNTIYRAISLNHELPKPIALNCWKHHLGYIKSTLSKNELFAVSHVNIHEVVQSLGDSNIDFYLGTLEPISISAHIITQIESKNALNINDFKEWIFSEGSDYKDLVLSDGSNWTIRIGQSDERYIHIHPSRFSKKTIRVKSSTLKTIVAYFYNFGVLDDQISAEKVNFVRQKIIKLPPFKSTSPLVAVSRVAAHFLSDLVISASFLTFYYSHY